MMRKNHKKSVVSCNCIKKKSLIQIIAKRMLKVETSITHKKIPEDKDKMSNLKETRNIQNPEEKRIQFQVQEAMKD